MNKKKSPFTVTDRQSAITGHISSGELQTPAQLLIITDSYVDWFIYKKINK